MVLTCRFEVVQIVHKDNDLSKNICSGPRALQRIPGTSGHRFLHGAGGVSLEDSWQGQSTGQRRTVKEFLPPGEATLAWGNQRGPPEGDGEGLALWNPGIRAVSRAETQGCRLPEESEAGERRTRIKSLPPPPPAPARWVSARAPLLGLCNPGTWQPGEQRRGEGSGKEEKERRGAGMGGGKRLLWLAPLGVLQKDSWRAGPPSPRNPAAVSVSPRPSFRSTHPGRGSGSGYPSRAVVSPPKFSASLPRLSQLAAPSLSLPICKMKLT